MRYRYILWDFNGTLLDDIDASIASVSDLLISYNKKPMTKERYYGIMEMPIIRYYEKLFDLQQVPFSQLAKEFDAGYTRHRHLIRLADGAREALQALRERGKQQLILSSYEQSRIEKLLRQYGIDGYFTRVLGADNIRAESKLQRALDWLQAEKADPREVVVIGDLVHDFEVAQAMGVDCVLVTYGHQGEEDLRQCGTSLLSSLRQLVQVLEEQGRE